MDEGYAVYKSQLGYIRIGYEADVVTFLKKVDTVAEGMGAKTAFTDRVFEEVCAYFEGKRRTFTFAYTLRGTTFQKRVWEALCEIPYGTTCSYKELASAIGNEKASRAVGMANNKNPITIVVPCHRVIGANGKLVGYAGGLEMKAYLLEMEQANKAQKD